MIWVVAAVVWVVVPLAMLAITAIREPQLEVAPSRDVWASVESASAQTSTEIGLVYDWSAARSVYAPAWSGLVQTTSCAPGSPVESGQVLATIDRVDRIAFKSATPFSRELQVDDTGADVAQLHDLLSLVGIANPGGDSFTDATQDAVHELEDRIGFENESWRAAFDPSWIVFLPESPLRVASCSLIVGAPAPSQGETILNTPPVVTAAIPVPPAIATSLASDATEDAADAPISQTSAVAPGDIIVLKSGDAVSVAGHEIPFDDDTGAISQDGLMALSNLLSASSRSSPAILRSVAPPDAWIVPAASVVVERNGQVCAMTQTPEGVEPVELEVIGSDDRGTLVRGSLSGASRVLVAPSGSIRSCG